METSAAPAEEAKVVLGGSWSGRGIAHGRSASIELVTNDAGEIVAATATIHSPGGGILAGFERDPKAEALLRELLTGYDPATKTLTADLGFLRFQDWAPPGPRTYRAVEGVERIPQKLPEDVTDLSLFVDYLVLESTEPDVLIQAGISRTGVLVFLNGSRSYLLELGQGDDVVSRHVRPGKTQEIARFENLVFDLTGGLDFVADRIDCTISSPLATTEPIAVSLRRT